MDISEFIKGCANGIKDPSLIVMPPEEWKEILNFQAGELFPEIGYKGTFEIAAPTTESEYQIDLSGSTYVDLEDIKEVYLKSSNGLKHFYDNWTFDKRLKLLDLNPSTSKESLMDPASYSNIVIIWQGFLPTVGKYSEAIELSPAKIALLKKICIKEAIRRILLDHTKLDRYRTLVGRTNEYALLAMIRDLTTEIEISKRRLVDTHSVKTF